MAGQASESTTMIKGPRERSENSGYGNNTVNITQCDLKRTIQISDGARKYIITPIVVEDSASTGAAAPVTNVSPGETRRGGMVTYVTNVVDTGERKEMFGFNARHVKSSMTIESSPDACKMSRIVSTLSPYPMSLFYKENEITFHTIVSLLCML